MAAFTDVRISGRGVGEQDRYKNKKQKTAVVRLDGRGFFVDNVINYNYHDICPGLIFS